MFSEKLFGVVSRAAPVCIVLPLCTFQSPHSFVRYFILSGLFLAVFLFLFACRYAIGIAQQSPDTLKEHGESFVTRKLGYRMISGQAVTAVAVRQGPSPPGRKMLS
jgi:hypothetical protein